MDETYIKIKGKWRYLYRAVDKYGATVEFMVSSRRDRAAAKAFFRKAFRHNRIPYRIKAALDHFNKPGRITGKRKFIISPMGGFRKMHTAARTIAGIELMNMIKKKQLNLNKHIDPNLTPAQQFYRLASV